MPSSHRAAVTSLLWWMSRCACARQMTYLKTWCCWLFHDIQYKGLCALLKSVQVFNLPWSGWEISQSRQTSHLTHFSPRSRQVELLYKFQQGTKPLVLNIMKKSTTSCLEVCHLPSTSTSGHSSQQAGHCSSVAHCTWCKLTPKAYRVFCILVVPDPHLSSALKEPQDSHGYAQPIRSFYVPSCLLALGLLVNIVKHRLQVVRYAFKIVCKAFQTKCMWQQDSSRREESHIVLLEHQGMHQRCSQSQSITKHCSLEEVLDAAVSAVQACLIQKATPCMSTCLILML